MTRRTIFALAFAPAFPLLAAAPKINVFKTATCGCCGKWVEQLRAAGFDVNVENVASTAEYRKKYGVPESMQSCHTAVVNGYSLEGHVPVREIQRLLNSKAKAKGLAVPGMPATSPGMDAPHGEGYNVMLFQADGSATVYQ